MLEENKLSKLIFASLGILGILLIINFIITRKTGGDGIIPPLPSVIRRKPPEIEGVSPTPDAVNVPVGTPIGIRFDKVINEDSISYTINPRIEVVRSVSSDLKTIFLSPRPLFEPGAQYTVSIGTGDSVIKEQNFTGNYSFSFETSEELTESDKVTLQSEYDVRFNEAADEYERTHPLLELMPTEEPLFRIEYKGDGLYEYTLKGVDRTAAKEAMLYWWRQKGVEPDILNLQER